MESVILRKLLFIKKFRRNFADNYGFFFENLLEEQEEDARDVFWENKIFDAFFLKFCLNFDQWKINFLPEKLSIYIRKFYFQVICIWNGKIRKFSKEFKFFLCKGSLKETDNMILKVFCLILSCFIHFFGEIFARKIKKLIIIQKFLSEKLAMTKEILFFAEEFCHFFNRLLHFSAKTIVSYQKFLNVSSQFYLKIKKNLYMYVYFFKFAQKTHFIYSFN